MAEIMDNVFRFLASRVTFYAPPVEDFFPGDSDEEMMCRHDVTPLIKKRYLDGSFNAEFNFSFYAKSRDVIKARTMLESIETALNIETFTDELGLSDGRLSVATRPTPVSKDEAGVVVYTNSFTLFYHQEV